MDELLSLVNVTAWPWRSEPAWLYPCSYNSRYGLRSCDIKTAHQYLLSMLSGCVGNNTQKVRSMCWPLSWPLFSIFRMTSFISNCNAEFVFSWSVHCFWREHPLAIAKTLCQTAELMTLFSPLRDFPIPPVHREVNTVWCIPDHGRTVGCHYQF